MRTRPKAVPAATEEEPLHREFDRWWFGYGSPTSLGVFRIAIGLITFFDLAMLAADWSWWYGENGFMPVWLGQLLMGKAQTSGLGFDVPRLDLLSGVTDPRIAVAFFTLAVLAAVTTTLGLFTRVSAFVLAVTLVSLHHRDSTILHGGDTALRLAVIYLAVSPCGRACSLDRLRRIRRGEEEGPVEVPLYGQRLVQYNSALIYLTTVWAKWLGTKWIHGTATYYPARLAEFYRFPVPKFVNEMPFVHLTTYGTLVTEFSLATLVFFRPVRKYVLFAGVMLHGFIEYAMNIPLFSFLMISYYVCHFDGEEVTAYCRRMGERLWPALGLEVYLPPNRRLTPTGERFLHAVDPFSLVRYLPKVHPGDRGLGWDAKKDSGKQANPFLGTAYRAPGAWIFLIVPTLWRRVMLGCTEAAT